MNRRIGLILMVCLAMFLPGARGQSTRIDNAAPRAPMSFDGDWAHISASGKVGIDKISIHGTEIHPFGSCHPTDCDWGTLQAQIFASRVDAEDTFSLLANYDPSFCRTVIVMSLEDGGRLRVQTFTHFTDASRRTDYSSVEYFVRQ